MRDKPLVPVDPPVNGQPRAASPIARRACWWGVGALLAGLVLWAVPSSQVRLGAAQLQGLVGSYLYAIVVPRAPVGCLRVTDVRLPKTLRLEWNYPDGNYTFEVVGPNDFYAQTQNRYVEHRFDFEYGTPMSTPSSSGGMAARPGCPHRRRMPIRKIS